MARTTSITAARELKIIAKAHDALETLAAEARLRAIHWLLHRLNVDLPLAPLPEDDGAPAAAAPRGRPGKGGRSGAAPADALAQLSATAKAFVAAKRPQTEMERAACLASLAHTKGGLPSFKTRDITRLNQAAGGKPFANTAAVMKQGRVRGFFQLRKGGVLTLTPLGQRYVALLPDGDAARSVLRKARGEASKPGPKPGKKAGRKAGKKVRKAPGGRKAKAG